MLGIVGLFFLVQAVLIVIVVFVLRNVLEARLVDNTLKEFERYFSEDDPASEIAVVAYRELRSADKERLQKLAQKKFGPGIRIVYSTDKALMGGALIKTGKIRIGHSLLDRLKEGGIVKS